MPTRKRSERQSIAEEWRKDSAGLWKLRRVFLPLKSTECKGFGVDAVEGVSLVITKRTWWMTQSRVSTSSENFWRVKKWQKYAVIQHTNHEYVNIILWKCSRDDRHKLFKLTVRQQREKIRQCQTLPFSAVVNNLGNDDSWYIWFFKIIHDMIICDFKLICTYLRNMIN